MRGRMIAAFVAGMLCFALFMGAAVGAFYALSGDAQAQGASGAQASGKWQVESFPLEKYGTSSLSRFATWVQTMPGSCDIETAVVPATVSMAGGDLLSDASIVAYYRCADS